MKSILRSPRAVAAIVTVAGLGAAALAVDAQTFSPPLASRVLASPTMAPITSDAMFAIFSSAANTAETAEARLALQRSHNPRVRAFAQRMIDDHTTASVQLQAATRGMGNEPAPVMGVTRIARAQYTMLASISDFDAQYMLVQVPDHRNAIDALNWEIKYGKNAGLKDYASRTLPVVEQHLRLAQTFIASNGMSLGLSPDGTNAVINPPGRGPNGAAAGTQVDNNPATGSNGGSNGANSPTNPTQSQAAPQSTPGYPIGGNGTPPPLMGAPAPTPTRAP